MNEFIIPADELKKAMALASMVVERRHMIPALGMVRFDIGTDSAKISATDLDMVSTSEIPIDNRSRKPFRFLARSRLLSDIVMFSDDASVSIRLNDGVLTISSGHMVTEVRSLIPVEDWPIMSEIPASGVAEIPEAVLETAMRATELSIGRDETRYYLCGSYFHDAGDGKLTIVSTNGHILTKYETGNEWVSGHNGTLPKKTHDIIMRQIKKGGNRTIKIETSDGHRLKFIGEGWELTSKLIDGTFPDYKRVIPEYSENISFAISHDAVRRFKPHSRYRVAVKVEPGDGKMSFSPDVDVTITMPVSGSGDAVGFDVEYLKSLCKLSGTIRISGAKRGDAFRVLSEDPKLLQVIMPMRA